VVTIRTAAASFSSAGGWNGDADRPRISSSSPPVQEASISVSDPVDLKASADGKLYVLSRSSATVTQYDGTTVLRSYVIGTGVTPNGIDVDSSGNVYVAVTGDHQVIKLNPTTTSFQLDATFNGTGRIGKTDKTTGTAIGEFNAPFDVAVTPDGQEIAVSDASNHRIQRFTKTGVFIAEFGTLGTQLGQLNTPKGLIYDEIAELYIIDSGNNRVVIGEGNNLFDFRSQTGSGLGQLQGPANVAVNGRGFYVSELGNNRIQKFDISRSSRFSPLWTSLAGLGLSGPQSVTTAEDYLEEKLWIADTGNNRVILVKLPSSGPEAVWAGMKAQLAAWDVEGAVACFSKITADRYRNTFLTLGQDNMVPVITGIPAMTPVFIEHDQAEYRFQQIIDGFTLDFPVKFVLENGIWKILEY
jgi:streptogramin lyase